MTRTLRLITEDPSDAIVLAEIVKLHALNLKIEEVLLPDNRRGLNHMPQELPRLLEATIAAQMADDAIAVLIDAEWHKTKKDRHNHKQVAAICRQYRPHVKLIWAVQEIEAWILADSGVCTWLDIVPQATDQIQDPKKELRSLLHHRKRLSWRGKDRPKLLQRLRGDGADRNRSLKNVMRYLDTLSH